MHQLIERPEMAATATSSRKASSCNSTPSKKGTGNKSENVPVRFTGDWASDSKLSAISYGYWEDPFFRLFNTTEPKRVRRTSLICRGYYVRFRVCDYFLRRIIRQIDKPVQIVSLGCGMDTTYFRILPEFENAIMGFYELDFKSVITAKKSIILHNDILQVMAKEKLKLAHCDLRHVTSLEEALKGCGFDFNQPTIFYSECVVNYLRPHENFRILQWITSMVPQSVWLAYEQCNASDAFGQLMVSHFIKNGCPLLSLISSQNMEDQEAQLLKAGFPFAKVINAWDAFLKVGREDPPQFPVIPSEEQQFDEYEQLLATCLHYSVRIGVNGLSSFEGTELLGMLEEFRGHSKALLLTTPSEDDATPLTPLISEGSVYKVKPYPISSLPKIAGHRTVVASDGTILSFGGCGESSHRMKHLIASEVDFNGEVWAGLEEEDSVWKNSSHELASKSRLISENSKLFERLYSSAVYVPSVLKDGEKGDSVLIFGGRKSPKNPCGNDLIEISLEEKLHPNIGDVIVSSAYGNCPPVRWRHSMALYSKQESPCVLLFGGRDTETVLGDFWSYSIHDFSWTERKPDSSKSTKFGEPSPRHSHWMTSDTTGSFVYMIGGVSGDDSSLCEDAFWVYNSATDEWTNEEEFNYVSRRIGHIALKHKNQIIIFGGYGADSSYNLDHFASVIDLDSRLIRPIVQTAPREELFLPFGFSAVLMDVDSTEPKILVFGGGGNCFSFGTHYNHICFAILLNDNDSDDKSSLV